MLTASLAARAQEPPWNLRLSAFGTVGVVDTSTHAVEFRRNTAQPRGVASNPDWNTDSLFGVQASARMGDDFLGTFQVISRYEPDGSNRPEVAWACVAWTPFKGFRARLGIQGYELLPSFDVANLGYAYLWVRPPVDVFGGDNVQRMKGLELDQTFEMAGDQSLKVWGYYGREMDQVPLDHVGLWDGRGNGTYGGALIYRKGEFYLRAGEVFGQVTTNMPPPITTLQQDLEGLSGLLHDPAPAQAALAMNMRGTLLRRFVADYWYESGPIRAQGALYRASSDSPLIPVTWRGFATLGYTAGAFTPYATFSRAVSRSVPAPALGSLPLLAQGPMGPQVEPLVLATRDIFQSGVVNQSTYSAGLRWDFAPRMDLKFQVDRIHSNGAGGLFYNPNPTGPPDWNGRMTVFSLALDFIVGGGR